MLIFPTSIELIGAKCHDCGQLLELIAAKVKCGCGFSDIECTDIAILESANLEKTPTWKLVAELKKRVGVETFPVDPYKNFYLLNDERFLVNSDGPATVLVVTD